MRKFFLSLWRWIQVVFGVIVALVFLWCVNCGPDLGRAGNPYW